MRTFLELGDISQLPNMERQPPVGCPRQFYTGTDKSLARPWNETSYKAKIYNTIHDSHVTLPT